MVSIESYIMQWMLSDHLGSTSTTANSDGTWNSTINYTAFGEIRANSGITATEFRYTGQLRQAELGLYYYVARWYDPALAHFTSADTVVPNASDSAAYDRYAYVKNNPIKYSDPTGHCYNYSDAAHASACDAYWRNYGLAWQISLRKTNNWIIDYTYSRMIRNSLSRTTQTIKTLNANSGSSNQYIPSKTKAAFKADAFLLWENQVGYGKEWDYKVDIQMRDKRIEIDKNENWQKVKKNYYYYDTWSNIHYGYIGAAAGFNLEELQEGAGAAQAMNELSKAKIQPYDFSVSGLKGFDPASDREGIRIGYDLYQQYGLSLSPEDLITEIEASIVLEKKKVK